MQTGVAVQAAPFVQINDLNNFLHKAVCVTGKVVEVPSSSVLKLQDSTGSVATVVRPMDSPVVAEPGMILLVRGVVNQDLSIAESPEFPTTDLGDKFDLKLYHDTVAVLSKPAVAHIFTA